MKISHLILGSLIALASFLTNHAEAGNRDLPPALEKIKGTKVVSINDLDHWMNSLVHRIILRSDFGGDGQPRLAPIATLIDGEIVFRQRDDVKALSKSMLHYLASTRICDLNLFGECVVYDKRSNDDTHIFVIGSQLHKNGTVEFLQSTFNSRLGRGSSASIYSLAERLSRTVDSRSVIFTRATRHF